jgi:hypothetical protein
MRAGIVVNVTRADRRRLEVIVSDRCAPQKHVWRAQIILATAPIEAQAPRPAKAGYELVINLKALGIEIPSSILARADEVIE